MKTHEKSPVTTKSMKLHNVCSFQLEDFVRGFAWLAIDRQTVAIMIKMGDLALSARLSSWVMADRFSTGTVCRQMIAIDYSDKKVWCILKSGSLTILACHIIDYPVIIKVIFKSVSNWINNVTEWHCRSGLGENNNWLWLWKCLFKNK